MLVEGVGLVEGRAGVQMVGFSSLAVGQFRETLNR